MRKIILIGIFLLTLLLLTGCTKENKSIPISFEQACGKQTIEETTYDLITDYNVTCREIRERILLQAPLTNLKDYEYTIYCENQTLPYNYFSSSFDIDTMKEYYFENCNLISNNTCEWNE